ncbi:Uncharacterised protein [Weissella viridescens]|uniref:Uncharacterized protein n=1 Tax=Weissella viridescens TaxID=1629 RepID=A0A380P0L4_WEIVI|nr:Uncharacterised protein [Weissella viridescens]
MATVSDLMKFNFDWTKLNQMMDTISPEAAKVSGYVYEHMTLTDEGFNYIVLTNEILESFDLGDFGTAFIVPLMGKINAAKAWAVFEQQDEGFYRARYGHAKFQLMILLSVTVAVDIHWHQEQLLKMMQN